MSAQSTSPWLTKWPDVRRFPKLTTDIAADVAVIGGGIAGVAAAHFLAREGRSVVLLEANHLGTGETGFTTALLTSSVDSPLSLLREQFGNEHIRLVRSIGEETIALIEKIVSQETLSCGFHRLDALAMGLRPETVAHLEREFQALRAAGGEPILLGAEEVLALTGVAAAGAVRIPLQGAFDIRAFLLGLAERIRQHDGQIFEETRMTGLELGNTVNVKTSGGTITAGHAVLATGLFPNPYKEQNSLFRQMVTYVIALVVPDASHGGRLPDFLYWDVAEPFHYMRFLYPERSRGVDGLFLIGGEDRPLKDATKAGDAPWRSLEAFATSFVPDRRWEVAHQWRGQILETADALPAAGVPTGGDPRILLLSGFGGNGMTLGTRAGKVVSDLVTGALTPNNNPFRFERKTLRVEH